MLRVLLICLMLQTCECRFRVGQGVKANVDDWKFAVKLDIWFEKVTLYTTVCTGTLVHYQQMMFILTAGHCFQHKTNDSNYSSNKADLKKSSKTNEIVLFDGTIDVSYPTERSRGGKTRIKATFKDETVLIPAEFFRGELDNSDLIYYPMDFALIKVNKGCFGVFSSSKPHFLTDFEAIVPDDLFAQTCQTAGWGLMGTAKEIYEGKANFPDSLQVANLMALNYNFGIEMERCLEALGDFGNISDLPLCLVHNYEISEKPIVAGGDSGGPTFCHVNGQRKFAGVTSARKWMPYTDCNPDGKKLLRSYRNMVVLSAPVNNVINFISKHEWKPNSPLCSIM